MKIWVDDVREAPDGYMWCKCADEVIKLIDTLNIDTLYYDRFANDPIVELIDLDHDAGDYAKFGGDYIKILDYMEECNINNIAIHIHSMNPVGVENMRRIIRRNGWEEV